MKFYLLLLFSLFVTTACQKKSSKQPEPVSIAESFTVLSSDQAGGLLNAQDLKGQYLLGIKKDALDKPFLLRISLLNQNGPQAFTGFKTRLVRFTKQEGRVVLTEDPALFATSKSQVEKNILLLASYEILFSKDDTDFISFKAQAMDFLASQGWRAHEEEIIKEEFDNVKVRDSFVSAFEIIQNEHLMLTQKVQIELINTEEEAGGSKKFVPSEVRWVLTPHAGPQIQPIDHKGNGAEFGYFVGSQVPYLKTWVERPITRFSPNKKIIYALSANTPEEWRPYIKSGIEYWNQVKGEDFIEVIVAPPGVSAPRPEMSMIQWVDFPEASYAYADAQLDPSSGEILNAQVFLPSAWVSLFTEERLRSMLKKLKAQKHLSAEQKLSELQKALVAKAPSKSPMLNLVKANALCFKDLEAHYLQELLNLQPSNINKEVLNRMHGDYLAAVVAHEVGHTLGLRHNFAGSLAINYPASDRNKLMLNYLEKNEVPADAVPSSSVMEYSQLLEDFIMGSKINNKTFVGSYDRFALSVGYGLRKDLKARPEGPLFFCTDLQTLAVEDCQRFDYGDVIRDMKVKENAVLVSSLEQYVDLPKELKQALAVNHQVIEREISQHKVPDWSAYVSGYFFRDLEARVLAYKAITAASGHSRTYPGNNAHQELLASVEKQKQLFDDFTIDKATSIGKSWIENLVKQGMNEHDAVLLVAKSVQSLESYVKNLALQDMFIYVGAFASPIAGEVISGLRVPTVVEWLTPISSPTVTMIQDKAIRYLLEVDPNKKITLELKSGARSVSGYFQLHLTRVVAAVIFNYLQVNEGSAFIAKRNIRAAFQKHLEEVLGEDAKKLGEPYPGNNADGATWWIEMQSLNSLLQ